MKLYKKGDNLYLHKKVEIINNEYAEETTLINADGVVTSASGGNGWEIYPESATYGEVYRMLAKITDGYPRWQTGTYPANAFFKTPQKGIITKYTTTQWCDDNITGRICNNFELYGFETKEDLLSLANGTLIFHHTWSSAVKGQTQTVEINNNKAYEYYCLHMQSNFAGDSSYTSMGRTNFYMQLPDYHSVEITTLFAFQD